MLSVQRPQLAPTLGRGLLPLARLFVEGVLVERGDGEEPGEAKLRIARDDLGLAGEDLGFGAAVLRSDPKAAPDPLVFVGGQAVASRSTARRDREGGTGSWTTVTVRMPPGWSSKVASQSPGTSRRGHSAIQKQRCSAWSTSTWRQVVSTASGAVLWGDTTRACSARRSRRVARRGAEEGSDRSRTTSASSPGASGGSTRKPACSRRLVKRRSSSRSASSAAASASGARTERTRRRSTVTVISVSWAKVSGPALPTSSR